MLINIQVLRLASALLIVLVHADAVTAAAGWPAALISILPIGTDLFLVTSAFLTLYVSSRSQRSSREFLINRVARIVPFYWFMTLVVAVLALALPSLFNSTTVTMETLLKSLLFVPYLKGSGLVQPIVFVAWTLYYLILFAVINAAAMAVSSRGSAPLVTLGSLLILSVFGYAIQFNNVPIDFYTAPFLLDLALGVAIFIAYDRLKAATPHLWVAFTVLGVSLLAVVARVWMPNAIGEWRPLINGLPAAGLLTSALMLEWRGARIHHPRLNTLANATYGVYLTHFFITQLGNKLVERIDVGAWALWGLVGVVLIGAVLSGLAAYLFVEKPLTKLSMDMVKARRPAPPRLNSF